MGKMHGQTNLKFSNHLQKLLADRSLSSNASGYVKPLSFSSSTSHVHGSINVNIRLLYICLSTMRILKHKCNNTLKGKRTPHR